MGKGSMGPYLSSERGGGSSTSRITGGGKGSMCASLSTLGGRGGSVYTRLSSIKGVIVFVLT